MNGTDIRKVALITMLVFYAILLTALWLMHQAFFLWVFVWIGAGVGGGEIASVIVTGKTLSTNFTQAMKEGGRRLVLGWIACSALILAIAALVVHLLPWK